MMSKFDAPVSAGHELALAQPPAPPQRTEEEALRQATALLQSRLACGRAQPETSGLPALERYAAQRDRLRRSERARLAGLLGRRPEDADLDALRDALAGRLAAQSGGLGDPRLRQALIDGVIERLAVLVPDWQVALGLAAGDTEAPETEPSAAPAERPPLSSHDWHGRLAAELGRHLGREVEIRGSRQLPGGVSNLVFEVDALVGAEAMRLCLRVDGLGSQHPGILTKRNEQDVLALVSARGVPCVTTVARVASPVGEGDALVSVWLDGETAGRRIATSPAFAAARPQAARALARALATVHGVTQRASPTLLPDDPPPLLAGGLGAALAFIEPRPAGNAGFLELEHRAIYAWLVAHRPAEVEPRLVHGDLRLGNLMVTPDGLAAVLDWELAHWGDPCRDFAWAWLPPLRFGQPTRTFAGLCDLEEFLGHYEAQGGAAVDRARLHWWRVLMCRWAIEFVCTDWEFTQAGLVAPWELPLGFEALLTYEALRLIDAYEREGRAV